MATDASFASTPNNGSALLGAAETSQTAPTQASKLITFGQRVVTDGATNSTSPNVHSATLKATVDDVGATVTGTNIPANAYIGAVLGMNTVVLFVDGVATNATGTGSALSLTITRPRGGLLSEVVVEAVAATSAGFVYMFLSPDNGTTFHEFDNYVVSAQTPNAGALPPVGNFRQRVPYANQWVQSGWSLWASQSLAANANILKAHAFSGDM